MNENKTGKNEFNSYNEFGEFRFREKRKRPNFSDDNNEDLNSKKSNNRGEIFPTKIFKPDSSKERKSFKLQEEFFIPNIAQGTLILTVENDAINEHMDKGPDSNIRNRILENSNPAKENNLDLSNIT